MANVNHADLTGSALHEPKGVASAAANTVYTADGSGSGAWTDVNTLLTTTNFTTGDAKLTLKTSADSGWVLMNDGTIGDALSTASTRANADCEDLFTLLWNNVSDTYAAVSTGRGANAAADWAAHKTIALTKVLGRAFIGAGSGSGLTARSLGATGGTETHALTSAEGPTHTHVASSSTSATHTHGVVGTTDTANLNHQHTYTTPGGSAGAATGGFDITIPSTVSASTDFAGAVHTHTVNFTSAAGGAHDHTITVNNAGSGTAHPNMQPFTAWNIMIKL